MSEFNLEDLKQIIPYRWRVQSYHKKNPQATMVCYVDARDVANRLDQVVGVENWEADYKEIKSVMYCGIGIYLPDQNRTVWKWDCGTESNTEKEKGESSDAFKRSAVRFGLGRFLYDIPIQYLETNEVKTQGNYPKLLDNSGNVISQKNLNKYLETIVQSKSILINLGYTEANNQVVKTELPIVYEGIENIRAVLTKDEFNLVKNKYVILESFSKTYKTALKIKYNELKNIIIEGKN